MFISQKIEWRRTDAKAETWETMTTPDHVRGTVMRQNPELGDGWLASMVLAGEPQPLCVKPTRLEAQAAVEGSILTLNWTAPEMTECVDPSEVPAGTVQATVNCGSDDDRRIDIKRIQVGETDLVELDAGGTRYVLDEHQLHRMLIRIHGALGDRLAPVPRLFLRKASDALEGGASFEVDDDL